MNKFFTAIVAILISYFTVNTQVPINVGIKILKAEDARRYDKTLEDLMKSPNAEVRTRSALAAGRIGDETAVMPLLNLLEKDSSIKVRAMAAFALGEIESIKAADGVINRIRGGKEPSIELTMTRTKNGEEVWTDTNPMARLVEAAGKIAAANPTNKEADELREAVLSYLETHIIPDFGAEDRPTIELALTALLRAAPRDTKRARPDRTDLVVAKFLTHAYSPVSADALNTLARLRARNANTEARELLKTHTDPIIRANAARVLGAAEDKDALDLLLNAAITDKDSRVRVAAIRALGSLKDPKAANMLLNRGEDLARLMILDTYFVRRKRWNRRNPALVKSELFEIVTAIARIIPNTNEAKAVAFLTHIGKTDGYTSSEVHMALATVSPKAFFAIDRQDIACYGIGVMPGCREYSVGHAQGLAELAKLPEANEFRSRALNELKSFLEYNPRSQGAADFQASVADYIEAYRAFKPLDLNIVLPYLNWNDPFVRAAVAGAIADTQSTRENVDALKTAFTKALLTDKRDNDAQISTLDALYKLDKKESVGVLLTALNAPDYLVRKKGFDLLADKDLQKDFPGVESSLTSARKKRLDQVLPFSPINNTKLGQVLNTDADYRRALSRKNGSVKAVLTTEKGTFTIDFYPEQAPLTVDNFIKLARSKYFDGLEVHRVVPNFVMQDGDPRGDGNGGPGWSIRCEVNMLQYDRGAVGMALSGKDTGGSQWFVTHSPQPHLDGGYTVFGRVNETDMKVVDNIVRGDKILNVKIVEANLPQRTQRKK